jgi:hypothetical protein
MSTIRLFYSYSHKDEHFREKLETHLSILKKNGYIEEWHDRQISAGHEWEEDINLKLEEADIILLLVSSNFLASDYCYDTETIRALEKHDEKGAVVIPIILTPCLWRESRLKEIQSLPRDNKPISTWSNEDEAWLEVANGVLDIVKKLRGKAPGSLKLIDQQAVMKYENPENPETVIVEFLNTYSQWYFSPLRIQRWGSQRQGFSSLRVISTGHIRKLLENMRKSGKVKTKISQKGNTIYKAI